MSDWQVVSDWLKYRFKPGGSNHRLNGIEIDVSHPLTDVSAMSAAVDAVNRIVEKYPAPYTLLVSGGVDSQAMMLAWKESGHQFKAVHYSYFGENEHDFFPLDLFCEQHEIELEIRQFDARAFICGDELVAYAKKYDCGSPQILTYIKFAEQHDETIVMSGNFLCHQATGLNYTILGLARYALVRKGQNFVPFFFQSTGDLAHAFRHVDQRLTSAHYDNLINGDATSVWDSYDVKCRIYRECGFDVLPQEDKFTGFERIKASFDGVKIDGRDRIRYANRPSRRPFDVLYRYRLTSQIGEYSEVVVVVGSDK